MSGTDVVNISCKIVLGECNKIWLMISNSHLALFDVVTPLNAVHPSLYIQAYIFEWEGGRKLKRQLLHQHQVTVWLANGVITCFR